MATAAKTQNPHAIVRQPLGKLGSPHEFGRLGDMDALKSYGWAKIPTYYYDFTTHSLPFTQAEFEARFMSNIKVFANGEPVANQQTNAEVGSGVNTIFLACAVGIVAIGEGEAFSVHGAMVPTGDDSAVPIVPGMTEGCDEYCGAVRGNVINNKATLWWGGPTWRFIEKFFQAFRLSVLVQRRFEIVNESLLDIGMTPLPPEFVGASDSRIPTMPFIRAVNDVLASKEDPIIAERFVTANTGILAGSCGSSDSCCLPPPLAGVTYGHPRIIGLANRIYPLCQPILFTPGMRFDVNFVRLGGACESALQNTSTINETTADGSFNDDAGVGADCGAITTVPGGCISLGVVMKGIELWPQAAVQFLNEYVVPGGAMGQMYGSVRGLQGLLSQVGAAGGTIGKLSAAEAVKHAQGVLGATPRTIVMPLTPDGE